jgi:hypothetical protein
MNIQVTHLTHFHGARVLTEKLIIIQLSYELPNFYVARTRDHKILPLNQAFAQPLMCL